MLRFHGYDDVPRDGMRVLVSRWSRAAIEVDGPTADAIRLMERLGTPLAAAHAHRESTDEDADFLDLATFLVRRGFVAAVDDVPVGAPAARTHLPAIQPSHVAWARSPVAVAVALALLLAGLACATAAGVPLFSRHDLFPFRDPGIDIPLGLLLATANTYAHELAHLLVARAYGVRAGIRWSRRLHLVVMETDVSAAWILPRRRRIHIFLAGMLYNSAAWGTATLLAVSGLAGPLVPIARFLAAANLFALVLQLFVWARTDLYFVLAAALREPHLRRDSITYLAAATRAFLNRRMAAPPARCPSCQGGVRADAPSCLRCGAVCDPAAEPFPFDYARRRRYLAFGLSSVLVTPLAVALLLPIAARYLLGAAAGSLGLLRDGLGAGEMWTTLTGALALGVVGLHAALLSQGIATGARRILRTSAVWGAYAIRRWAGLAAGVRRVIAVAAILLAAAAPHLR